METSIPRRRSLNQIIAEDGVQGTEALSLLEQEILEYRRVASMALGIEMNDFLQLNSGQIAEALASRSN